MIPQTAIVGALPVLALDRWRGSLAGVGCCRRSIRRLGGVYKPLRSSSKVHNNSTHPLQQLFSHLQALFLFTLQSKIMAQQGGCVCENIRYSIEGEPVMNALCHCLDCRKISGSVYSTNAVYPEGGFKLLKGTPKQHTKTADGGNTITSHFW